MYVLLVDLPLLERRQLLAGGTHDGVRRADVERVAVVRIVVSEMSFVDKTTISPHFFSLLRFFHRRQRITKKRTSYQPPASVPKPACAAAAASLAAGSLVHPLGWRSRSAIGMGSTF